MNDAHQDSYICIRRNSLEQRILRDMLDGARGMYGDIYASDPESRTQLEETIGAPLDTILLIFDGLVLHFSEQSQKDGSLTEAIARHVGETIARHVECAVRDTLQGALTTAPIRGPNESQITITETRREISASHQEGRPILAGATDRKVLLEALKAGRKLSPAQRQLLQMKRCSRCGEIKPFTAFATSTYADGRAAWCTACEVPSGSETDDHDDGPLSCPEWVVHVLQSESPADALTSSGIRDRVNADNANDYRQSTIDQTLSQLVRQGVVEKINGGYRLKRSSVASVVPDEAVPEEPETVPASGRRAGMVRCNQCQPERWVSPRDLAEHKRVTHPIGPAAAPTREQERSLVGSSLKE